MKSLQSYVSKGRFYKSVVDDGSDLVFVVDYEGNILYHNAAVRDLGYRPGSLNGKSFFDFMPSEGVPSLRKQFTRCCRKEFSEAIEFEFLTKSGERRHYEFNAINLRHQEGLDGLILDCRDITQRKKLALALIEAQKAKDLFLANISHEIRTPVNGIVGMTTLLSQDTTPQEQQAYLTAIRAAAENLKVIINDILDLAAIESGKMQYEQIDFDLRYLLQTLVDTYRPQAVEKGLALRLELDKDADRTFIGDPVRINQVLTNLVGNALKFTHQGHILLRCTVAKKAGKTYLLRFEVEDTGIGIPADKLSAIFESFTQADASITRKYGGTGLGLTIARQLVSVQNGTIAVTSKAGKGSTFTVVLPLPVSSSKKRSADAKPAITPLNELSSFQPLSVLLVEDNEINRLYAGSLLKKWKCRVEMAENGKEAIEKLALQTFDLILMDVQMPVMDGYEATRIIRSGPAPGNQVPILALTANASVRDMDRCLEAGMNECLSKPFTPEQLFRQLQKFKTQPSGKQPARLINLAYLENASQKDTEFVKTMVKAMVSSLPDSIKSIREQSERKNWQQVAANVHRIKSSLSMLGMEESRRNAALIEEMVYNQQTERVGALASALCIQLDRAIEELRSLESLN
ncbi:MAG: response regulator [Cyclobacteriaceae bacterium]|nr:response regulator [Cyclobacteriaceae bacterium]